MSAAKDEAEDGPLKWNNEEDDLQSKKTLGDDDNEQTQDEDLLTPKLSRSDQLEEEDDKLAPTTEVESEEFGPLQTSSPVPDRPSSAEESLSIPDDTLSLQVRPVCPPTDRLLTALGLNRIVISTQRRPFIQLWPKSNTLLTAL